MSIISHYFFVDVIRCLDFSKVKLITSWGDLEDYSQPLIMESACYPRTLAELSRRAITSEL